MAANSAEWISVGAVPFVGWMRLLTPCDTWHRVKTGRLFGGFFLISTVASNDTGCLLCFSHSQTSLCCRPRSAARQGPVKPPRPTSACAPRPSCLASTMAVNPPHRRVSAAAALHSSACGGVVQRTGVRVEGAFRACWQHGGGRRRVSGSTECRRGHHLRAPELAIVYAKALRGGHRWGFKNSALLRKLLFKFLCLSMIHVRSPRKVGGPEGGIARERFWRSCSSLGALGMPDGAGQETRCAPNTIMSVSRNMEVDSVEQGF